jgi:hypothetical protein
LAGAGENPQEDGSGRQERNEFRQVPVQIKTPSTTVALQKKADVAEYSGVFNHVGLLFNGPPDKAGLPFI